MQLPGGSAEVPWLGQGYGGRLYRPQGSCLGTQLGSIMHRVSWLCRWDGPRAGLCTQKPLGGVAGWAVVRFPGQVGLEAAFTSGQD